ncbi:ABC transporter permease [Actinomadura alba]|uniref:ABC transporter permease n=1 Tax=Actinomadura alba TaxID=406431 RepID=A0ABR7LUZ5_9ACTN|nr:ABC transporter permease [Actinomadura alba]MBC6468662.1 ABC transporter permease [Actinomadura alba]
MTFALHAEWTKLRTSPGTLALLVVVVAGTVGVSAAAAACSGPGCGADLPKLSLTGVQLGQAVVAILAVLVMGNEYSSGMVKVTLTAVPRRSRVLAAKAVVVAAVVAVAAAVAVAGSLIVGRLLLPTHDLVLRPAVGSVLYLVLVGLLSLGTATAVRNPAAAISVVLTLLYALPIVTGVVTDPAWQKHLQQIGPASAGLAAQATTGDLVIGPWKGLGVLALWAFGALLAGGAVLKRRDA